MPNCLRTPSLSTPSHHCPLLPITVHSFPSLSPPSHHCPLLPITVHSSHHCPLLPITVPSFPSLSTPSHLCPPSHYCPLLPITVPSFPKMLVAWNQASAQSVSVTNYSRGLWRWMCFSTHGLELRADVVSWVVGTELHSHLHALTSTQYACTMYRYIHVLYVGESEAMPLLRASIPLPQARLDDKRKTIAHRMNTINTVTQPTYIHVNLPQLHQQMHSVFI